MLPPAPSLGEQSHWQGGTVPSSQCGSQAPSSTLCSLGLGVQAGENQGKREEGQAAVSFFDKTSKYEIIIDSQKVAKGAQMIKKTNNPIKNGQSFA